ncbi:tRNA (cytidine(56)-2'-O)-methyltransferase, partial [Candidatus Woesearchaeota archaeon]|nr:tRNA (cytidine(56)-2'-O)-methyltransferase [Candidatus Woesearchaeota archaeon]
GPFSITYTADPLRFVKEQKKQETIIVHLTVYGISVGDILPELQTQKKNILVIIGGEKVPPEYYHLADFNISVGSQPHSEVAGLAVFLDRYFEGKSIFKKFEDVAVDILPMTHGKKVVPRKQKLLKEDHR